MFITWTTRSRGWSAFRAPPRAGDPPGARDEFAEARAVDGADPAEIDDDAGAARIEEHVHGLPKLLVTVAVDQAPVQLQQRDAGPFLQVELH